ncbi:hypothetical protein M409DRAFT_25483 [Zasmidium cellare ATCC 36951]|uniref:Uncharacterized protein n=1 Tax=Zasmidium cellare ATCC 36951 TaxID=1080233 RepID=A0A6A6CFF3_ZASCE|nr:uncharacterized protein M409DRAFT_25483 [Zasmidium cellare ATCC 36951]KAF2164136.1 hypothetical protein M409DRAFT_25483 [Zasmidium cellare ATCC 36951]
MSAALEELKQIARNKLAAKPQADGLKLFKSIVIFIPLLLGLSKQLAGQLAAQCLPFGLDQV